MRHTTDALFQTVEALRRRVEELELVNAALQQALRTANNDNASLARRVQYVEKFARARLWADEFTPPEGESHAVESQRRDEIHEEGQEQDR